MAPILPIGHVMLRSYTARDLRPIALRWRAQLCFN